VSFTVALDGPSEEVFSELVRSLPDGSRWMFSATQGSVIIAREESRLVREAILTKLEDGRYDLEVLASAGVNELALQVLVGAALLSCVMAITGTWLWGPEGWLGLLVGVVFAGTIPAMVLAAGQRVLDPGRDEAAEEQLQRAVRMAIAQCDRARLLSTGD